MGRPQGLVGSMRAGVPGCPTHPGSSVVLNGTYGKLTKRQRFLCRPLDGSAPHKFSFEVPRMVAAGSHCDHCENRVTRHLGPTAARRYEFPVTQAAEALVLVGQGVSYTETAARLRAKSRRGAVELGGQLIANWVEVLGPVVAAEHAETVWPETVVLDATWFMVTNTSTGTTSQAFSLLAAHGYESGENRGRVLGLHVNPSRTTVAWETFLRSRPGRPRLVICDDDVAIVNAARNVWGKVPHLCEYHLRSSVLKPMAKYGLTAHGSTEMALLNEAFRSTAGWRDFSSGTRGIEVLDWIRRHDWWLTRQVRRRPYIPAHYSIGALEASIQQVREFMEPRAFCYRNATRTNRMLELVRLRINRVDDPLGYARSIRQHLDDTGGKLTAQGTIRDPRGHPSLR